ncbi:hypothetical protein HK101_011479 [Irineochytrium annulatum]|nr:hypothetical protein HK101_011479 [Irineochytrium annulatum]
MPLRDDLNYHVYCPTSRSDAASGRAMEEIKEDPPEDGALHQLHQLQAAGPPHRPDGSLLSPPAGPGSPHEHTSAVTRRASGPRLPRRSVDFEEPPRLDRGGRSSFRRFSADMARPLPEKEDGDASRLSDGDNQRVVKSAPISEDDPESVVELQEGDLASSSEDDDQEDDEEMGARPHHSFLGPDLATSRKQLANVVNQVNLAREASTLLKKGLSFTAVFPARMHAKMFGKFRIMVLALGCSAEVVLTAVGLGLHWTPIVEPIMTGSCIPADYHGVEIRFPENFGQFLEGDSDFAQIYNYGLPLVNGIVSGWAAWPLVMPSESFSVKGTGVGFLVGVECGKPVLDRNVSVTDHATYFSVEDQLFFESLHNFVVTVTVPANSHSYAELAAQPIKQQCAVRLSPIEADVEFSFVADEWLMVTGGQIQHLNVRGSNGRTLGMSQGQSQMFDFDDVSTAHGNASGADYGLDIQSLVSEGLHLIAQESPYTPTQGGTYSNILRWATLPDGLYHPELMWRGVAAIAGATGHCAMMQYNSSAVATCTYMGMNGSGRIATASSQARDIVTALVGVTSLMVLLQAVSWFVSRSAKDDENVQRGVQVLRDPMMAFHALCEELVELVPANIVDEIDSRRVEAVMRAVVVRLGECKSTRGEAFGVVKLGTPSNVVKLTPGRDYVLPSIGWQSRREHEDEREELTAITLKRPRKSSSRAKLSSSGDMVARRAGSHSLSSVSSATDAVTVIRSAILKSTLYSTAMKATQALDMIRDETMLHITCVTLIMLTALAFLMGVLWYLIGKEMGTIMIVCIIFSILTTKLTPLFHQYNMMHAMLAATARFFTMSAGRVLDMVRTAKVASRLVKTGLPLREVLPHLRRRSGHVDRFYMLVLALSISAEVFVTIVGLSLLWTPVDNMILVGACIPATYNASNLRFPSKFGQFLQGDTDFARVYQYGLPLQDGMIGGWPAWPVDAPMSEFSITASGIGYRISATCDNPIPVDPVATGSGTWVSVSDLAANSSETTLVFNVTAPAGSHSYHDPMTAILQVCTVRLGAVIADISYDFKVDEWSRKTTVKMNSVSTEGNIFRLETSAEQTYGQVPVADANDGTFDLSSAISNGLKLLNKESPYFPTQGATFCNLMQWGTLPDGEIHPELFGPVDIIRRSCGAVL